MRELTQICSMSQMICLTVQVARPSVQRQKQMPEKARTVVVSWSDLFRALAKRIWNRINSHVNPMKPRKRATIAFNCIVSALYCSCAFRGGPTHSYYHDMVFDQEKD